MRIGSREIGPGHPPYVIAEIGVNHDGEIARALELTDAAAEAGADAVKVQYFETDRLMSRAAKLAAYQRAAGETDPVAMLRRLELTLDEMAMVVERAHARGIHAIVTVFSVELVEPAAGLAWDAFKSASPDVVNRPLLEALAAEGKPLIVSTGASTWLEVQESYHGVLEPFAERVALLHCVSSYPTPRESAMIAGILGLDNELLWDGGAIGYSDHTPDVDIGRLAVRIGASILEKHLTYDRSVQGPDHAASLEPDGFREYVRLTHEEPVLEAGDYFLVVQAEPTESPLAERLTDEAYGRAGAIGEDGSWDLSELKCVQDCERDVREVSRQSLVTTRDLAPGETITRGDLTIKRPGTGIDPWRIDEVVGRTVARKTEADTPIVGQDLDPPVA